MIPPRSTHHSAARRFPAGLSSIAGLAAAAFGLAACGGSSEPLNPGRITAFVSVPPQATIVEAIGGDLVVVEVLAGPGQDPHAFTPSPKEVMTLGRAEVWFTTRMPFEKGIEGKVTSGARGLKIVHTADAFPAFPPSQPHMDHAHDHDHAEHDHDHAEHDHDHAEHDHDHAEHDHDHAEHDHDHAEHDHDHAEHDHDHAEHDHDHHGHDHSAGDPHLWLAPAKLQEQAVTICQTLVDLDPANAGVYEQNLEILTEVLTTLDKEVEATLEPHRGATFLAYHGAFGWFADQYGLIQQTIEFNGRSPETRRLRGIIDDAKAAGIRVVFTQPQYDRTSAEAVAEGLGGTVVEIDPLDPDLINNIKRIAEQIAAALSTPAAAPASHADTPTPAASPSE